MFEKLIERRPVLTAAAIYAFVVAIVFWPVWAGQFLVNPFSDMLTGYAPRAFAAALQCLDGGCGVCHECHTALSGSHPDVNIVVPAGLHLLIADAREIVATSARAPLSKRP